MLDVTLTDEQQAVVDHAGGVLRVCGGPGTGRTTALMARYLRLVGEVSASSVVVLCPTRGAADRFLAAVLPHVAGGFDALPVTTIWGLAYDLVSRHDDPPSLVVGAEQVEEVRRLLAADGPARWPSSPQLLGRPAFGEEVAGAVGDVQASSLDHDDVLGRAQAAGGTEARARWADLLRFTARYRSALRDQGLIDAPGLLVAARRLLERPGETADHAARFAHVLVDDADTFGPAAVRLVAGLATVGDGQIVLTTPSGNGGAAPRWARLERARGPGSEIALTRAFRSPPAPSLVTCTHPAVEPEAVAGELLAAHDDGVPWSEMAVLVRQPDGHRARAVARALARHAIPTTSLPGDAGSGDEPVVRAVLDVLRWVNGEVDALDRLVASPLAGLDPADVRRVRREAVSSGIPLEAHPRLATLADLRHDLVAKAATSTPADLAFEVWRRALGHLADPAAGDDPTGTGQGDRALDALVAFVDGLARRAERRPHERLSGFLAAHDGDAGPPLDPWRAETAAARSAGDAVTVTSITRARGREWHTVVVAGCVEGELPRVRVRPRLFDRALLETDEPPTATERRRRDLSDERALFDLACTRATGRLLATAAPEPGVLLSRFVEGWPAAGVRLPLAPGPVRASREPSTSTVAPFPDGHLRLSASQLATYDDCPLRYYYEYVLGARAEAGVHAALGSLVHAVLATFLDPTPDVVGDFDGEVPPPRTKERLLALGEEYWRDDIAPFRPQVEEARRDYFAMLEAWWEAEGADCPEVLAVERRFEVDVGPHRLTGFIDRVDRADTVVGGEGAEPDGIRIVDYKTGKKEPAADAVADDLQLAVYHLAATRDPELVALGPPTQLRLLYVRRMHGLDQEVRPDHEATTEARVLATADRILAEEFEPSVEANCRLCSFQRVCPLQPEGRTTGPDER